ncbi:antibiotic transport system permease domain protein [Acinetobacter sp. 1564232]|nr:antibiotic transport system permease domain protein [Acinetobacter sp. 1564232]
MKEFLNAYLQTFKDIVGNSSVFTTLILSVILYSFFTRPPIKLSVQNLFLL